MSRPVSKIPFAIFNPYSYIITEIIFYFCLLSWDERLTFFIALKGFDFQRINIKVWNGGKV